MKHAETKTPAAPDPWDIGFGAVLAGLALLALLVWFPSNIKGGFVETNHAGKLEPGDAFFPVLLAGAILALSALHIASALLRPAPGERSARLARADAVFLVSFHVVVGAALAVMYWLGPLVTALMNAVAGGELTYRQLLDTPPYKYIGYAAGGLLMTLPLIAWVEGRLRWGALWTVIGVIAAAVLVFDVLLINVQLPPNADY